MNVFRELAHSIYDFKSYGIFLKDRKRKTFLFGCLLILFYYLITIGFPFARFQMETGGVLNILDQEVPEFEIAGGGVHVKEVVDYEDSDTFIYVDTSPGTFFDEEQVRQTLRAYNTVLVMDSEQLVFQNGGQFQNLYYEDIDPSLNMTKGQLMEIVRPYVTGIIGIGLIVIFLFMLALFFFGVLVVALLGMIVASCMGHKLTFGELYKLGIYTRTTPLLLKAALSFLPFGIPMFFIINFGISLLNLAGALRAMNVQVSEEAPLSFYSEGMEPEEDRFRWRD